MCALLSRRKHPIAMQMLVSISFFPAPPVWFARVSQFSDSSQLVVCGDVRGDVMQVVDSMFFSAGDVMRWPKGPGDRVDEGGAGGCHLRESKRSAGQPFLLIARLHDTTAAGLKMAGTPLQLGAIWSKAE